MEKNGRTDVSDLDVLKDGAAFLITYRLPLRELVQSEFDEKQLADCAELAARGITFRPSLLFIKEYTHVLYHRADKGISTYLLASVEDELHPESDLLDVPDVVLKLEFFGAERCLPLPRISNVPIFRLWPKANEKEFAKEILAIIDEPRKMLESTILEYVSTTWAAQHTISSADENIQARRQEALDMLREVIDSDLVDENRMD